MKRRELAAARVAMKKAIAADEQFWGWAMNEMTNEQNEALGKLLDAVDSTLHSGTEPDHG